MAIRRQQTSMRTVEAYHRALNTMGKLAAQQAGAPRPARPVDPDHPYVRVVRDDTLPPTPPRPPSLRSRSRRARQAPPTTAVSSPGPNTRIVVSGDDPAERPPPSASPSSAVGRDRSTRGRPPTGPELPDASVGTAPAGPNPHLAPAGAGPDPATTVGRPVLHFDASDDYGPAVGPAASWAEVEPTPPHRAAGSRSRARPSRPRRRASRLRAGSRTALRHWRATAAVAAALVIAAVVAASLVASVGTTGGPSRLPARRRPPTW